MGLYTSVQHPETGNEIQFKTGFDACDWVDFGYPVPWAIFPEYPGEGYLLDDVYWGSHGHVQGVDDDWVSDDCWVVIKDHVLVAVHDMFAPYGAWMLWYGIETPPREWWTEEVWAANAERARVAEEEYQKDLAAGGDPISVYLKNMLNQPSFAEQMLPMTLIEETDNEE